jgi:glycosyltransferase involved in cell wall biosynthesis
MEKLPKISIITPCFNHGRYIYEMLESVFVQTFKDYEVIIVNDGSTDDTREILENIAHEKVNIIHTENRGPASARNLAIENSRAPIIMNLDADDKISPSLLEKAYHIMTTCVNTGIVYSEVERFGTLTGKFDVGEYSIEKMLYDNRIVCNAFFRKADWEKAGGFSSELIYGLEDWDFWLSVIELGREVVKIPETLVYYRAYNNPAKSRSGRIKKDRVKIQESLVNIFHRHERLYASCPKAWQYFAKIEKKLKTESFLIRRIKNYYFSYFRRKT